MRWKKMRNTSQFFITTIVLSATTLLWGCTTTVVPKKSESIVSKTIAAAKATGLKSAQDDIVTRRSVITDYASAEPDESAYNFLARALKASQPTRSLLQLAAAQRFLEGGIPRAADRILDAIHQPLLTSWITSQHQILSAALALEEGNPKKSLRRQANFNQSSFDSAQQSAAGYLKVIALLMDDQVKNALELVHVASARENAKNHVDLLVQTTLDYLSFFSEEDLDSIAKDHPWDVEQLAWIDLANKLAVKGWKHHDLQAALTEWLATNPQHPARTVAESRKRELCSINHEMHIALILPISSKYADAAIAFREGFKSHLDDRKETPEPLIMVYDFGNNPDQAEEKYNQAVVNGADFIVGPLGREAVNTLANRAALTVPTLLIGKDKANVRSNAFSLDLSRKAEARSIVAHARKRGLRTALFLYNNGQEYQDAAQEAEATWSTLGGAVADRAIIPSNVSDYSELISRLLGLDASKKRVDDMEKIIGSPSITDLNTRVRPDLDVIFMFTNKVTARVLKPQLDFHKAGRLAIYALNLVFNGQPDVMKDLDLEGVMFSEMPSMLDNYKSSDQTDPMVVKNMGQTRPATNRFNALGADSYLISCFLLGTNGKLKLKINGASGILTLNKNNLIQRQSSWVIFKSGRPTQFRPVLTTLTEFNSRP
ncbi:MAG: penicillin-binding protein activator [Proteobacteria bacterium]|nr:penicillin-binding protein activator [Pseudomonadota bacterium]MBT4357449.1 penicillin-binding protein activator [Pseudomonadota bacterium]MBT4988743.1 penicillin-binding protein activator [Pseudomonadota bacterium]MBT5625933.1 penicillin-binding protein activator [Pseudomonadota bacterium]MBT6065384.1 penicillin-binding protein activator [Pseudomonadota bacterium]